MKLTSSAALTDYGGDLKLRKAYSCLDLITFRQQMLTTCKTSIDVENLRTKSIHMSNDEDNESDVHLSEILTFCL